MRQRRARRPLPQRRATRQQHRPRPQPSTSSPTVSPLCRRGRGAWRMKARPTASQNSATTMAEELHCSGGDQRGYIFAISLLHPRLTGTDRTSCGWTRLVQFASRHLTPKKVTWTAAICAAAAGARTASGHLGDGMTWSDISYGGCARPSSNRLAALFRPCVCMQLCISHKFGPSPLACLTLQSSCGGVARCAQCRRRTSTSRSGG